MSSINLSLYSNLTQYAVLAQTGITTVNTTTINNGLYGNAGGSTQIIGAFVPAGSPSGEDNDFLDINNANNELIGLKIDFNTVRNSKTSLAIPTGSNITFLPGINYNSGSSITFTNTVINFDASGDSSAQFYIFASSSITFTGVTINLLNGASQCNIFWVADTGAITFTTTPAIYGFLIAGTAVTFTTTSTIFSHIYAQTANVTFSGTTLVDATCTIPCYLKGTKIMTEKGYIAIEYLKENDKIVSFGNIDNEQNVQKNSRPTSKPITWISNFTANKLTSNSYPICIKAHAFGVNTPFQDLYVSPNHRILQGNSIVNAEDLINGRTIFQDRTHTSATYYHLELDTHSVIKANGLLAESFVDIYGSKKIFKTQDKSSVNTFVNSHVSKNRIVNRISGVRATGL
jgi:hypothetical protein